MGYRVFILVDRGRDWIRQAEGAPYELYTRSEAERLINYAEEIIRYCKNILSKI